MVHSEEEAYAMKWDSEQRLEWPCSDLSISKLAIHKTSLLRTALLQFVRFWLTPMSLAHC
jgi:hypothetical protein